MLQSRPFNSTEAFPPGTKKGFTRLTRETGLAGNKLAVYNR